MQVERASRGPTNKEHERVSPAVTTQRPDLPAAVEFNNCTTAYDFARFSTGLSVDDHFKASRTGWYVCYECGVERRVREIGNSTYEVVTSGTAQMRTHDNAASGKRAHKPKSTLHAINHVGKACCQLTSTTNCH